MSSEFCARCDGHGHKASQCQKPPRGLLSMVLQKVSAERVASERAVEKTRKRAPKVRARKLSTRRCARCGESGHYSRSCTQTEITNPRRFCGKCGKLMPKVFSGDLCRPCWTQENKRKPRSCVHCGGEFVPNRSDSLVCSNACKAARMQAGRAESRQFESLNGQRFGDWTVVDHSTASKAVCACACGKHQVVETVRLRNGSSTACAKCVKWKAWLALPEHERCRLKQEKEKQQEELLYLRINPVFRRTHERR